MFFKNEKINEKILIKQEIENSIRENMLTGDLSKKEIYFKINKLISKKDTLDYFCGKYGIMFNKFSFLKMIDFFGLAFFKSIFHTVLFFVICLALMAYIIIPFGIIFLNIDYDYFIEMIKREKLFYLKISFLSAFIYNTITPYIKFFKKRNFLKKELEKNNLPGIAVDLDLNDFKNIINNALPAEDEDFDGLKILISKGFQEEADSFIKKIESTGYFSKGLSDEIKLFIDLVEEKENKKNKKENFFLEKKEKDLTLKNLSGIQEQKEKNI